MDNAKNMFDRAKEKGKVKERGNFLRLGEKLEGGGIKSTGAHKIKLVSDSVEDGTNGFTGKPEKQLHTVVIEDGQEKIWTVSLLDKDGNLDYRVARLAEFKAGDVLVVELKHKGMKNYTDIAKVVSELPDVQLDEVSATSTKPVEGGSEEESVFDAPDPF